MLSTETFGPTAGGRGFRNAMLLVEFVNILKAFIEQPE